MDSGFEDIQHALNAVIHLQLGLLEERIAALEAAKPEPLTYPTIDLGLVEGTK